MAILKVHALLYIVALQVSLKLDERELEQALQDKVLVSAILKNGLPWFEVKV